MDWTTRGKRGWLVLGLLVFAIACGDEGCSTCDECGIAPIPGGYPLDERIPNAVQVRLTEHGINFVQDDIEDILGAALPDGLRFEVPEMEVEDVLTLCPSRNCYIEAEIPEGGFTIDLVEPNVLEVYIQLIVSTHDADGNRAPIDTSLGDTTVDVDTRGGSRDHVGALATIALTGAEEVVNGEPWAYTSADVQSVELVEDLEDSDWDIDVVLCECGILAPWCCIGNWTVDGIVSLLEGTITDLLNDEIGGMVDDLIGDMLCMTDTGSGCPTGTENDSGTCYFPGTDECVPMLLGLEGQGDLGAELLGGFAPGAHGRLRFLAALGGDGRVVNEGLSLSMFGGLQSLDESMTVAPGHNPCVPQTTPPALPDVPIAGALEGNTVPGTGDPTQVGIGVSESFINHAGWGVFDSGMLCVGAGANLTDLLVTGTLSIFIGSLNDLTFPDGSQPVAIMLQPKQPPAIDVRTDAEAPLLGISLPELEVDMYAFIQERYVRFMTLAADVNLEVDLAVDASGIMLDIGDVAFDNASIINDDLITEDADAVVGMLEGLIPGLIGGLLGDELDAIELPELMGFELDVPEGGIQGFEDGGEDFLGIFANLAIAEGASFDATDGLQMGTTELARPVETEIREVSLKVEDGALALETFHEAEDPVLTASVRGQGAAYDYEYSYRLDGQPWSIWAAGDELVIQDRLLRWQGRHTLEVRARQAGVPASTDPTPARTEVIVDGLPPEVWFEPVPGGYQLMADDIVSPNEALEYRHRDGDGGWTDWSPLGDGPVLDGHPDDLDVQVRDEAGNVAGSEAALIRGVEDPNATDACDCAVPGGGSNHTPLAGLALLLLVGMAMRRRWQKPAAVTSSASRGRARRLLPFLALPLAVSLGAVAMGCGGSDDAFEDCGGEVCEPPDYDEPQGTACCEAEMMCVPVDLQEMCPDNPREMCRTDAYEFDGNCNVTCHECFIPPLNPGQLATYLDMASRSDGSLVLSGFNPGNPRAGRALRDLVVGVYDGDAIQWEIVDGVPQGLDPVWDEDGWRGGVDVPGEDVGRWTSLAVADDDTVYVSYYDQTNTALKLAIGTPGGDWAVHTVDDEGDAGRYTSVVLEDGAPRIAYLQMLPEEDDMRTTRARVAIADGPNPGSAADWAFTTAHEVAGMVPPLEDHPIATGLFNNLVVDGAGLALVWYDRTRGNIHGARWQGDGWGAPFLIDGWDRQAENVGDSGLFADVFVEDGAVWHVTYVDGVEETLRYARVEDDVASNQQVIDDGTAEAARHIVGDNSSVTVVDGQVRVAYQDATAHLAKLASLHEGEWTVEVIDDEDATGFWTRQVPSGQVATFWMGPAGDPSGVRVLSP